VKKVRDVINGPIGGLAPWIAMSLLAGPGRFELAVGVAFALSLVVVGIGRAGGGSWKILELSDITFFTLVGILGLVVSQSTLDTLDNLSGEMSNVALTLIAFGSILFRMPFTLQYAREEAPRELWDNPAFVRTNYVLTAFWGGAFLLTALAGAYGDVILDNSNNLWTGWVIQTLAILIAIQFTEWYPKVVKARAPDATEPAPPLSELLLGATALLIPVGVIGLVLEACSTPVGIGLVVIGIAASRALDQHRKGAASAAPESAPA
jgi:hypothetical protein